MKKSLSVLFIGNSHTFVNDVPLSVRRLAEDGGFDCRVVMIAHGGWRLSQHVREPDVRFNLLFGGYDYAVLQEYAQPFGPVEEYRAAALALNEWVREGGAVPVLYETWARKDQPEMQESMNKAHRAIADEIGALLAPVAEAWQTRREDPSCPELYADDGGHASPDGSALAAKVIWETIRADHAHKCDTARDCGDEKASPGSLSPFCTCADTACPFHPTNHADGCAPCVSKNLSRREIPSCFFKKLGAGQGSSFFFEDFAKAVLEDGKQT